MDESVIPVVIDRVSCTRHNRAPGHPCWWLWLLSGRKSPAICNQRARSAGFNGEIDPRSLRKN